jgi:general secretion pathway protein K
MRVPHRSERGLALVSVLWTLMILSLIAASLLTSLDFSYRLVHNGNERARAEALAEAGVARAVLALLERRPERRWRVDGAVNSYSYAGASLRISIQDERGKIDLNAADQDLLQGLFRSAGLDAQAASALTDRVLDWRDAGELHRLNGAKDATYAAAGVSYHVRNGPFQTIDELKLVMGVTPALFDRIKPAITVYSGSGVIDPEIAPRAALLALANMDPAKADAMLAVRSGAAPSLGILNVSEPLGGRAFTIRTELDMADGIVAREVVVRLTDDPAQPYWVLAWR